MTSDNVCVFSTDIQNLKGVGIEYLLDLDGNVLAKFSDGEMKESPLFFREKPNASGFIQIDVALLVLVGVTLVYLYGF